MSELVCKTLDHDATDVLIDKWLEHQNGAYWDWFTRVRERRHAAAAAVAVASNDPSSKASAKDPSSGQVLLWNKGEFVPENVFCRTVDTGRLIPLDRTWSTHVYHHASLQDRKLSMMPVVFTMLPELMLLRGMHDHGSDDVYIIVTDLKRQEMEDITEYFKLVCRSTYHDFDHVKPSLERQIEYEHMRISHTLSRQRRTPCFPQIDLTFRAIVYNKRPPFIILFSHQPASFSQIFFTHRRFVPSEEIYFDFPSGCPNPCCNDECEMIRFPRRGADTAAVLAIKRGGKGKGRRVRPQQMCNWIDCSTCFDPIVVDAPGSEGSQSSVEGPPAGDVPPRFAGLVCSKCKLVKYCSADHQRKDWEEHRRMCRKL